MFDAPLAGDSGQVSPPAAASRPRSIAVIGSGIAGLSAAWLLSRHHPVTVFEAAGRPGGHSNTVDVPAGAETVPVDAGFIVHNERTYPNLTALFRLIGVKTVASDMSFAVSIGRGRVEYVGAGAFGGLFAQKRNLLRPRFWRMIADILRFYREMGGRTGGPDPADMSLGALLDARGYSDGFRRDHLLPMAAAIWSGTAASMLEFPAASFLAFCRNHGLLQIRDRPLWRSVAGGSRDYVRRLVAGISGPVRLNAPVAALRRDGRGVEVIGRDGTRARFDAVVVAVHADRALAMLESPTAAERRVLGAFTFQKNRAILHGDASLMPLRRRVWSSWNYMAGDADDPAAPSFVTYWMNRLQNIDPAAPVFLSLNAPQPPRDGTAFAAFDYDHPQFDAAALAAQAALPALQGVERTWFCGAWTGHGFHEDGLVSGMAAARAFGVEAPWQVANPALPATAAAPAVPVWQPAGGD